MPKIMLHQKINILVEHQVLVFNSVHMRDDVCIRQHGRPTCISTSPPPLSKVRQGEKNAVRTEACLGQGCAIFYTSFINSRRCEKVQTERGIYLRCRRALGKRGGVQRALIQGLQLKGVLHSMNCIVVVQVLKQKPS